MYAYSVRVFILIAHFYILHTSSDTMYKGVARLPHVHVRMTTLSIQARTFIYMHVCVYVHMTNEHVFQIRILAALIAISFTHTSCVTVLGENSVCVFNDILHNCVLHPTCTYSALHLDTGPENLPRLSA